MHKRTDCCILRGASRTTDQPLQHGAMEWKRHTRAKARRPPRPAHASEEGEPPPAPSSSSGQSAPVPGHSKPLLPKLSEHTGHSSAQRARPSRGARGRRRTTSPETPEHNTGTAQARARKTTLAMLQAVTFQRLRNGKNFRDKAHARGSAASYLTTFNLPNAAVERRRRWSAPNSLFGHWYTTTLA